jgi:Uncharacterized protein conserved in bacteria (DUF2213)
MKAADSYLGTQLSPHKVRSETDGSLICRAVVAASGYQDYRPSELGIGGYDLVPVYRPKEEVLSDKFLSSLNGAAITSDHPTEFVNPQTHKWISQGFATNAARGPDRNGEVTVECDLHFKTDDAIRDVQAGKTGLSVGYLYNLENENGRWTMRNLKANHIALVDNARQPLAQIEDSAPPRWDRLLDAMRDAGAGFERMISKFHRRNAVDVDASEGALRSDDPDSTRLPSQESLDEQDEIEIEEPMNNGKEILDALNTTNATMQRMFDALIAMKNKPSKDGECNCGGKDAHSDACPKFRAQAEDMDESFSDRSTKPRTLGLDVIPVDGSGGEGNENPLSARDCETALNHLRGIRHFIADSGDPKVINAYNNAVKDIKRKLADALMRGPERVGPDPARQAMDDARSSGEDFEEQCKNFHRAEIPKDQTELSEIAKKRPAKAAVRRFGVDARSNQREIAENFEDSIKAARDKALTKK